MPRMQQAIGWFLQTSKSHPKSLALACMGGSTVVGSLLFFALVDEKNHHSNLDQDTYSSASEPLSAEQARLQAMIEHTQNSSWRENLKCAVQAQEHFMLPGRHYAKADPAFMKQIDQRTTELLVEQHKRQQQQEAIQKQNEIVDNSTKMWK